MYPRANQPLARRACWVKDRVALTDADSARRDTREDVEHNITVVYREGTLEGLVCGAGQDGGGEVRYGVVVVYVQNVV